MKVFIITTFAGKTPKIYYNSCCKKLLTAENLTVTFPPSCVWFLQDYLIQIDTNNSGNSKQNVFFCKSHPIVA